MQKVGKIILIVGVLMLLTGLILTMTIGTIAVPIFLFSSIFVNSIGVYMIRYMR